VIVEILVGAGETVPVGTPLVRIGAPGSAVGPSGAARLPSAAHGVAAAGGPALGDAASPSMGGSEGMAGEDPGYSVPSGVVHDITMPKLGEHLEIIKHLDPRPGQNTTPVEPTTRSTVGSNRSTPRSQPVRRRHAGGAGQEGDRTGRRRARPHQ
jgi:pyruvate/2-oxoglutarate dehydrogenase complex dihydrolipoamide acyltransferase (E2) component